MKKKWNRVKAMLMAVVMMLAMALPGGTTAWAETIPTTTLRVTGIEENAYYVYAYAIVLADVDENRNTYWKYNTNGSVADYLKDSSLSTDELISIYTSLNTGTNVSATEVAHDGKGVSVVDETVLTLTYDAATNSYQATGVKPGLYVLAAGSATYSYEFSVVPVNYTYGSDGTASINETFSGVVEYAVKTSSIPSLDKVVVEDNSTAYHGDASIGDTVNFKVTVTVPNYDSDWKTDNLHFVITDSMTEGLTLDSSSINVEASTSGTINTSGFSNSNSSLSTYTLSFTLDLYGADVYNYAGQTLTITYSATVSSSAGVNFDKETNKVSLKYSTTANSTDLSSPITKETYHYTFGFDTTVNGTGTTETTEITKYGVKTTNTGTEAVALEGAKFQLKDASGKVMYFTDAGVYTGTTSASQTTSGNAYITTDSSGHLVVSGIDAGTYTLTEYQAPAGYALDTTEYTIVITPTYATDNTLASYTVTVSGGTGSNATSLTFTHTINTSDSSVTTQVSDNSSSTFAINNTPLTNLPETGGMGIVLVTIAAVVMMVLFGTAFMALKKKKKS